ISHKPERVITIPLVDSQRWNGIRESGFLCGFLNDHPLTAHLSSQTRVNSCISRQFRGIERLSINWNDGCVTAWTWSDFQTAHIIQCLCSDSIGSPTTLRLSRSNYQHHEGARIHSYIHIGRYRLPSY